MRQLRFLAFAGLVAGAAAGQLALRRLPGNPTAWLACGAAYGLAVITLGYGAALATSGRRFPAWPGTVLGGVLIAWSVADALGRGITAGHLLGRLALWPLQFDAVALVPVALIVALLAIGFAGLPGLSLEAAERRTSLVGQLKFAVTLQDLRTVLVLRRQLAMELPRSRPSVRGSSRSRSSPCGAADGGACSGGRPLGSPESSSWRWWRGWHCGERGPARRR